MIVKFTEIEDIDLDALALRVAKLHLKRTGNANVLGSVAKEFKALFPDIMEAINELTSKEEERSSPI